MLEIRNIAGNNAVNTRVIIPLVENFCHETLFSIPFYPVSGRPQKDHTGMQ
jgi:hypothetical protein